MSGRMGSQLLKVSWVLPASEQCAQADLKFHSNLIFAASQNIRLISGVNSILRIRHWRHMKPGTQDCSNRTLATTSFCGDRATHSIVEHPDAMKALNNDWSARISWACLSPWPRGLPAVMRQLESGRSTPAIQLLSGCVHIGPVSSDPAIVQMVLSNERSSHLEQCLLGRYICPALGSPPAYWTSGT